MFFSSTRFTLIPHLSVASSYGGDFALMISRRSGCGQLHFANDVPQSGGGEVFDGVDGALYAVGVELASVRKEHHGVDLR